MFGIGAQQMVLIGLLALVIFGPGKLPRMARVLGGFVHKARASMEEFKEEFLSEEARKDLYERREENRGSKLWEPEGGRKPENDRETGKGREPAEGREGDRELDADGGLRENRRWPEQATVERAEMADAVSKS